MKPALVFEDNDGAIKLGEDRRSSAKKKHFNARYHHIRTQRDENS